ncbi:lysine-specific demethylase 7B-like isoform X2 [Anneissia japonica]|uniref:lysine-specific demethylase 7B-like isoform X2 n=1 Tax=Anneissia japonica TaxID=1529436 RepID=UPI001425AC9F|nr:lysine-specific demethylase 7B-like isoform X2 [Anneissia japonica]
MACDPVYCICKQPYDVSLFMIECNVCNDWFHGSCVGVREDQCNDIEEYHCPNCSKGFGPLTLKKRKNWHRHDHTEEITSNTMAVQTGTLVFIKELKNRTFANADEILLKKRGWELSLEYFSTEGFDRPILIDEKDGLDMVVPPPSFSVRDVESLVGSNYELDVIDVQNQETNKMLMKQWREYYNHPERDKVLNVISLEFSKTKLSEYVLPPRVVREMSWVDIVWPEVLPEETSFSKPTVSKYCLMSVKDSYTDFHVDFGGTSVWYHILKGEKIFYLIKPSLSNLTLYERWVASSNQNEMFFGDQVNSCYRCRITEGQTFFIPTGWIHAVLTDVDSLVFGGNFLHTFSIPLQIRIYELEKRLKTPQHFQFPWFEMTMWYAAKHLLDLLKNYKDDKKIPPTYILEGSKELLATLRSWTGKKENLKCHQGEIPESVQYSHLIKDLNKQLKEVDKHPKPSRAPSQRVSSSKTHKDKKKQKEKEKHNKKQKQKEKPKKKKKKTLLSDSDMAGLDILHQITERSLNPQDVSHRLPQVISRPAYAKDGYKVHAADSKSGIQHTKAGGDGVPGLKLKFSNGKVISRENSPSLMKMQKLQMESDEEMMVDVESDVPNSTPVQVPLKFKLSYNGKSATDNSMSTSCPESTSANDSDSDCDVMPSDRSPKVRVQTNQDLYNIDALLQASQYEDQHFGQHGGLSGIQLDLRDRQTSPSMKDAIQGMLSIALPHTDPAKASSMLLSRMGAKAKQKVPKRKLSDQEFTDALPNCFQDSKYVYPSLDDDGDGPLFKSRTKKMRRDLKDAPWNPKAKVKIPVPKTDRPTRDNARRPNIDQGLADAAARLANKPRPKRQYIRRKPLEHSKKFTSGQPSTSKTALAQSHSTFDFKVNDPYTFDLAQSAPSSVFRSTSESLSPPVEGLGKPKKPKKGMATAKQRLSKILKLKKGGRLMV